MHYKSHLNDPMYFMPTKQNGITTYWKSSPEAPPAPDYAGAAEATAAGNLEATKYATQANRVNQYTPWGSSTWTNTPTTTVNQAGYDNAMAKYNADLAAYNQRKSAYEQNQQTNQGANGWYNENWTGQGGVFGGGFGGGFNESAPVAPNIADYTTVDADNWSQTTSLTPELQAALDSQIAVQGGRSKAAETLLGQVNDKISTPLDLSSAGQLQDVAAFNPYQAQYLDYAQYDPSQAQQFGQAAFNASSAMLNPQYQLQEQQMRNNLALQGLSNTSEAFNNDMGQFYNAKNLAYNQLANQSLLTGNQLAQSNYNTYLQGVGSQNELQGLKSNNAIRNWQTGLQGTQAQNAVHQSKIQELTNEYNTPLNQLNALLSGQQVNMPQFSNFYQQQATPGADLLGAAGLQSQYDQGLYNSQAASAASGNAAAGQAVGTIAAGALMF